MENSSRLSCEWLSSVHDVDRTAWNTLALPASTPLFEHEWLSFLESSGSVTPQTGWEPRILCVRRNGELSGAATLYRKTHSEGEFVFDYFWAQIAHKLGISYFPKLVGMSPLTPIPAFQFLVAPTLDHRAMAETMCEEIKRICDREALSGVHFQFANPDWTKIFTDLGFHAWEQPCYIWENRQYTAFDDFLSCFTKNQRRNIRREQESLAKRGIRIEARCGDEIDPGWAPLMYDYYFRTNEKYGPWNCLYLTEDFFIQIFNHFRHRLLLTAAFLPGEKEPVGMSMFLRKDDRLWGRYWGSREFVPQLHFNLCYYEPIRWAIDHRVRFFDPGIGAAHKSRRGFRSATVRSLHYFTDPRLNFIFKTNIGRINEMSRESIVTLNEAMPFTFRETGIC